MKIVIAKCIGCGNEEEIKDGEVQKGDQPCCKKCGMPMVAERAKIVQPHQHGGRVLQARSGSSGDRGDFKGDGTCEIKKGKG